MAYSECGDLTTPAEQERVGADNEPVCPDLDQGCERCINVAFGACLDDMDLQSECAARCLRVLRGGPGKSGIGRGNERGYDGRFWHHLMQHVYLLLHQLPAQVGPACGVSAGSVEARYEPFCNGIRCRREDDRYRRRRSLCRER